MARARTPEAVTVHVRRGDLVVLTKGRDKGKRGKVKRVLGNGRIEVEQALMIKRHTKATQKNPQGGIIEQEGSINPANVALWCEKCTTGRRARKVIDEHGDKSRVCVKCGSPFPTPGM